MPLIDIEPGHTQRFLSMTEVAEEVLGLSRNHVSTLRRKHLLPTPDVTLGYLSGWDPARMRTFGRETGIIGDDGHRIGDPTRGARDRKDELRSLVDRKYTGTPQRYLGSAVVAKAYGQHPTSIFVSRRDTRFIPADIVISSRFGWREERVLQHAREYDLLTEEGIDAWAVTRAEECKLPPHPDWLIKRVHGVDVLSGEERDADPRPELETALADAGFPLPPRTDAAGA